ncbi:queuosine precursor transporter [Candidatus Dependentiae bacterium]|nr:queuosine precursor transporter [Candidatus Dependentiae bacterium]
MINNILFLLQISIISFTTIGFGLLGKEALVAYISLLFVIANIFVIKQIQLFSWYATSADAFIIGISLALNLLQEFWGKEIARKAIWISFLCSAVYMIMSQFLIWYIPTKEDIFHPHITIVLQHSFRIVIASFLSYLITQYIDISFYGYLKQKTKSRFFVIRNFISIAISQLLDTILFSFLGLYGILYNISHIILISYIIKLIAIGITIPWLFISKKILNK